MKKIVTNIMVLIIVLMLILEILSNSSSVLLTVENGFKIWLHNVFPSLFPFFVLSDILINYGFVDIINKYFKKVMNKLFKISGNASFILVMSIISGFPSNSKYTKELLDKGLIDINEANKILMFSHFSNPLFILGTLAVIYLKNYKVGLLVLVIHYLSNVIIGFIFRNYNPITLDKKKKSLKEIFDKKNNFGLILSHAIVKSIDTLLLILGTITICLVFTNIVTQVFNGNLKLTFLVNSLLEMTQGLNYVSMTSLTLKLKAVLSVMILSFGGISVHMQVMSILSDYDIKYLPYLLSRLLHALISGFMMYFIFDIVL